VNELLVNSAALGGKSGFRQRASQDLKTDPHRLVSDEGSMPGIQEYTIDPKPLTLDATIIARKL
jgi:hypothetical protein